MKKSYLIPAAVLAAVFGIVAGYLLQGEKTVKGYPGLGGDFTLQSADGQVSLSDFEGDKVVALYFGYVSCPDACPITLGRVSAALQKMKPEQRSQVQMILVSVDPERDTPELLAKYTAHFGEEFVGLTGTPDQIAELANRYKVLYQKVDMPDSGMSYTVDHSSNTYIIGKNGVVRFIVSHGNDVIEMRDRIVDAINGV